MREQCKQQQCSPSVAGTLRVAQQTEDHIQSRVEIPPLLIGLFWSYSGDLIPVTVDVCGKTAKGGVQEAVKEQELYSEIHSDI